MPRIKLKAPLINTRAEAEQLVGEISEQVNLERRLAAQMDAQLQAVRERYEPDIAKIRTAVLEKTALAQHWAETHPEEFKARKSIVFVHGTLGFRTGTPKLKTLARWTWSLVLQQIKMFPWSQDFVRTIEDINKERILAAASAQAITEERLRAIGVRVVQEESFYVEPLLTEVETRQTVGL